MVYLRMGLLSWSLVMGRSGSLKQGRGNLYRTDRSGRSQRWMGLGGLVRVLMRSMGGIPPFLGFYPKRMVFMSGVQEGYRRSMLGRIVSSGVSVYLYLRWIQRSFFNPGKVGEDFELERGSSVGVYGMVVRARILLRAPVSPNLFFILAEEMRR